MKPQRQLLHKYQSIIIAALLMFTTNGYSCINCNKEVKKAINKSFDANKFEMFSGFIALTIIVLILTYFAVKHSKINLNLGSKLSSAPLYCTAMVLGMGLGGFADGIVLHQILQWHEMLSNKIAPNDLINKSVNMFWDGIFHLFTLMTTILGVYLLWEVLKNINTNKSGYLIIGGMLAGWGIFNVIEGIINHQILGLHNVRELSENKDLWNYGFLLFGLILLIIGWLLIRKAKNYISNPDSV